MYQVLEYDSGITYKIGEPYDTKADAIEALKDDAHRYTVETKGEVIWNRNGEGFKVRGLTAHGADGFTTPIRMWIRKVA